VKPTPILVAADVVVLNKNTQPLQVLLIQRKNEPYKNCWALPGGFVEADEDLPTGASRELNEETGINLNENSLTHSGTYGHPTRDPRGRVISVAFVAKINADLHNPKAADDAKSLQWFSVDALPSLAFDHHLIITDALACALVK
jgi:8-oxo-dGTP diphosphatase